MRYDIAGCASLSVEDSRATTTDWLRVAMDPYPPSVSDGGEGDGGDVSIACVADGDPVAFADIQNPANDSLVTAADSAAFYILARRQRCLLAGLDSGDQVRIDYEPRYPLAGLFRRIVRPALQLSMPARRCVAIHGAAVDLDGTAIAVAGWSESGKTETALALAEEGARFIADKWTVLRSDLSVAPFPISVGVRRWVVKYLPRLRSHLSWSAHAQFLLARSAAAVSSPLRRHPSAVADAVDRVVVLGDRAALRLSQVYAAYGPVDLSVNVPLRAVALLRNASDHDVAVARASPVWAARRLACTAAFERRPLTELYARFAFTRAETNVDRVREVQAREQELLAEMLADVDVLDVRAPFPTDPRRVADAIARAL
jgi:hypothetical protein